MLHGSIALSRASSAKQQCGRTGPHHQALAPISNTVPLAAGISDSASFGSSASHAWSPVSAGRPKRDVSRNSHTALGHRPRSCLGPCMFMLFTSAGCNIPLRRQLARRHTLRNPPTPMRARSDVGRNPGQTTGRAPSCTSRGLAWPATGMGQACTCNTHAAGAGRAVRLGPGAAPSLDQGAGSLSQRMNR